LWRPEIRLSSATCPAERRPALRLVPKTRAFSRPDILRISLATGQPRALDAEKREAKGPIEDGMTKTSHDSDVAFIQALAELLNQNQLAELSVKREYGDNDSLNVRVSKYTPAPSAAAHAPAATAAAAGPASAQPAAPPVAAPAAGDPSSHPGVVPSPMVGTVYLSPEPGSDPFITLGAQVSEGQTVLIIEAMKTMNHIPAPRAGTVKRILVEDGSPVEYGAPLLIIE
jgi:acetyl-CoA carboxylase biotin carboxyl carrier protein